MVREGVVLGHLVLGKGLEVDKAKNEVIQNLPFLLHYEIYRVSEGTLAFTGGLYGTLLKFPRH